MLKTLFNMQTIETLSAAAAAVAVAAAAAAAAAACKPLSYLVSV